MKSFIPAAGLLALILADDPFTEPAPESTVDLNALMAVCHKHEIICGNLLNDKSNMCELPQYGINATYQKGWELCGGLRDIWDQAHKQ